jgi:hypothetical protein
MFRREPAITKFDWLITPNHKSSQSFATLTGAALWWLKAPGSLLMVRSPGFGSNEANSVRTTYAYLN